VGFNFVLLVHEWFWSLAFFFVSSFCQMTSCHHQKGRTSEDYLL
jgi:hypothetical protein